MMPPGRLMGVDFGTVRIGLAICDPDRRIASPFATYVRQNAERDANYFREVVDAENVVAFIVGLPMHTDGREGQKAIEARSFGKWLADVTQLPVDFWDERFTTVEAERSLLDAGLTNKRRKARRDQLAAQIILQAYISELKDLPPPTRPPPPPRGGVLS
jgi:putative Holliday junction resolvase